MTPWVYDTAWAFNATDVTTVDAEVPWIFLFVFGIPLFFTLIYLMIQLTRPDRGGRIDEAYLPDIDTDPYAEPPESNSA